MSARDATNRGLLDLLLFARSYLVGGRLKLLAVVGLEIVLHSIKGVGLLLILPLLGLLGLGPGTGDSPIWQGLQSTLDRVGFALNLEVGLLLFVAVLSIHAMLNWRRATGQVEVEQHFQMSRRVRLYEAISRTELYCLQRLRTADFIQSTQSEIRRAQIAINVLFQLLSEALSLTVYFSVALILSVQMTLFTFVCGGVSALLMIPLFRKTYSLSRKQIGVRSRMLSNLIEHIQGVRTARTLGLTYQFVDDFRRRCLQAAQGTSRLTRLSANSSLIFEIAAVLLLAIIVYAGLGFFQVESARFVVLLIIFIRVFPSIGTFQNNTQQFISLIPSFRHYLDLLRELQQHEEIVLQPSDGPRQVMRRSLELRDVSFSYLSSVAPALDKVSLTIEKGALSAVSGKSGAGKSTLADIATGLLPSQDGGLFLDGKLLDEKDRILWRRETAVVPQESFLFNDSVRANLLCVKPDATDRELRKVLDAVNACDFIESKPDKLDRPVGERGSLLSGGERQRLSIARALLRKPQLLVLDEPTNNLDSESVLALHEVLENLRHKATLLVISHDPGILQQADRVFQLDNGVLVEQSCAPISVTSAL